MRFIQKKINKTAPSSNDDKRIIMADGIHTLAYGHTNLKNVIKKSYNEMPNVLVDSITLPNILVDSVVLPNKQLSKLEIIDAAKKLILYGFSGDF